VLTRAVALLVQLVMATGTQGDPIRFGIAAALRLRHEMMVFQVALRTTGNAEL
jgi:hypothetical protein